MILGTSRSVFGWLDSVRQRPGMYIGGPPDELGQLEILVYGYYASLGEHGLVESAPEMTSHFSTWLHEETGSSLSCGWASAITEHTSQRASLGSFFAFVDRYRKLRAVTVQSARLTSANQPTGKRVVYGLDGRMDRPTRVDIVRYSTTKFFFLRFWYGKRTVNGHILFDGRRPASHSTNLAFAKRWVADDLRVEKDDWRKDAG